MNAWTDLYFIFQSMHFLSDKMYTQILFISTAKFSLSISN